jgi:hypothetical protein
MAHTLLLGKGWDKETVFTLFVQYCGGYPCKNDHAQENKLLTGLVPGYVNNGVVILQYTDDTILCMQDSKEQATNLKFLLYLYESMSGLKINFSKSEAIMISQDANKSMEYVDTFSCTDWKMVYKIPWGPCVWI